MAPAATPPAAYVDVPVATVWTDPVRVTAARFGPGYWGAERFLRPAGPSQRGETPATSR